MEQVASHQLSGLDMAAPALPSFLRATSAITAPGFYRHNEPQENNYDLMVGGGAEEQYNTRAALAARERRKKSNALLMYSVFTPEPDNTYGDDGFALGRHARARRLRKRVEGEERRIATDEDGKRVVVDEEGRVATDAEGNRITLDDESGHRIADAGDGSRVIVDSQNRVLHDEHGKPIRVNAEAELIITTEPDGSRVAVTTDGKERLPMKDAVAPAVNADAGNRVARPGADLETIRRPAGAIAGTPEAETLARNFSRVEAPSTTRFSTFLAQGGMSLDEFQKAAKAASRQAARVPRGANISIPRERLNIGHIRGGRFLRMLTPNGFDIAIPLIIGAGVGGVAGTAAGVKDGVTVDKNGIEENFNWGSFGETALKTGGYTALDVGMFTGTGVALYEGRNHEAVVRGIEDGIEIASPFVLAGAGAAIGSAGFGVGAIPGAVIGFLAGSVLTIFASDLTRSIARGLGYEDVDRGMIGSFLAPEYMEEMESWVSQFSKDGKGWRKGESVADVIDRIDDGAKTPLERAQHFRGFMGKLVEGIDARQRKDIAPLAERIEADTGLDGVDAIVNALRIPGARKKMLEFYRQEAAANPHDEQLGDIVSTIEHFEASETERVNAIAAVAGGETMIAREANKELGGLMDDTGSLNYYSGPNARYIRATGASAVRNELKALGYDQRLETIRKRLEIADDTKVSDVVARNLTDGTDAYAQLGTRQGMFEAYALMADVDDQLSAHQADFVAKNWDEISRMMTMSNDIDRPWYSFSSDTTLGAALQDALRDADPGDPAAAELRDLLSQTHNLENLTPEMAAKLLDNDIFRNAFYDAIDEDPALREKFRAGGFEDRAQAIRDARGTMRRLETAGKKYGFTLEMVPADSVAPENKPAHAPNPAYAIPRAPAPAPAPY